MTYFESAELLRLNMLNVRISFALSCFKIRSHVGGDLFVYGQ